MRQRSGPVGCPPPPASRPAPSPSPPPPPSPPFDGLCLLFALLGVASRFCCLCWPAQVVFDEFHFGKFVSSYVRREYFFDIHPPLAKLLLALAAKAAGYAGEQPFLSIGEPYLRGVPLFALRALPAAAGAAAPPLAYRLCRTLRASRAAAALAAAAVLLDGALLVEARLLLTDSLLFGAQIGALLFALEARHSPAASRAFLANLAAAGAMIGCAVSIKWTALATMAVVGIDSVVSLLLTAHASLHDDSSAYSRQWRTSVLIGSRTSVALRCSLLFRALRPGELTRPPPILRLHQQTLSSTSSSAPPPIEPSSPIPLPIEPPPPAALALPPPSRPPLPPPSTVFLTLLLPPLLHP